MGRPGTGNHSGPPKKRRFSKTKSFPDTKVDQNSARKTPKVTQNSPFSAKRCTKSTLFRIGPEANFLEKNINTTLICFCRLPATPPLKIEGPRPILSVRALRGSLQPKRDSDKGKPGASRGRKATGPPQRADRRAAGPEPSAHRPEAGGLFVIGVDRMTKQVRSMAAKLIGEAGFSPLADRFAVTPPILTWRTVPVRIVTGMADRTFPRYGEK